MKHWSTRKNVKENLLYNISVYIKISFLFLKGLSKTYGQEKF